MTKHRNKYPPVLPTCDAFPQGRPLEFNDKYLSNKFWIIIEISSKWIKLLQLSIKLRISLISSIKLE